MVRAFGAKREKSLVKPRTWSSLRLGFRNFEEEAAFLRSAVEKWSASMPLRELTLKLIFPACAERDEHEQALTIATWVQDTINYVHENRETFQTPFTTMRLRAGDCDDQSLLVCSMLATVGIRNKLCILKIRGTWAHIFPVAICKTREGPHRLTLDTTLDEPVRELVNPILKLQKKGVPVSAIFV